MNKTLKYISPAKSFTEALPLGNAIIAGNAPDIEELRKDPPQLQIAEYPIRKMLDIK